MDHFGEKDQISVIQEQIGHMRGEMDGNIQAQLSLFKMVVVGLAALIGLSMSSGFSAPHSLLTLGPAIGMVVLAYWINQTLFLWELGRHIAVAESRINALAKIVLLSFEQDRLRWRQKRFKKLPVIMPPLIVALTIGYWWLNLYLYRICQMGDGVGVAVELFALAANVACVALMLRMRGEIRTEIAMGLV